MEIIWIIVIGTTIWVAYDAKGNRIPIDNKPYSLNNGALAWFLSCALLWIAGFPYYLYKRSKVLSERQTPSQSGSAAEELQKFKHLLDQGAITADEYERKKKDLLSL